MKKKPKKLISLLAVSALLAQSVPYDVSANYMVVNKDQYNHKRYMQQYINKKLKQRLAAMSVNCSNIIIDNNEYYKDFKINRENILLQDIGSGLLDQDNIDKEEVEGNTDKEEVEGEDNTDKEEVEGEDNTDKGEVEGEDNTDKEDVEGEDNTDKEDVEGEGNTDKEDVEGEDNTDKEEVDEENQELISIYNEITPQLEINNILKDSLELSWSIEAENIQGIKFVIKDGDKILVDDVSGDKYTLTGLEGGRLYKLSVQVVLPDGSLGNTGNVVEIYTPLYINSNYILESDKVIENLIIENGVIDLNGYKLTVLENVHQPGGTMFINEGELDITGDYLIDSEDESGSEGYLKMTRKSDNIRVAGNFTMNSNKSHAALLTAGKLEVQGNFKQDYNNDNFATSGTHTTIISGNNKKNVEFKNQNG